MNRIFVSILIIVFFIGFLSFDIINKSYVKVLKIRDAATIDIDLNRNGALDINETICIPDIQVFTSDLSVNQADLAHKFNLSKLDAIKFGYLSDNYSDSILADKMVKIRYTGEKTEKCYYADIIVENESYRNKLVLSGFGITGENASKKFNEQLSKSKNLNLVILNHKSNKYHNLDCEFGLVAHDAIIIPEKFLMKDAVPCKYCHITSNEKVNKNSPKIYPLSITSGNIKMFLTDLTTKLKPDNNCTSLVCQEVLNQINKASKSIDIALYGWDSVPDIYNALKRAKERGVNINIVYDVSEPPYYKNTGEILSFATKKHGDGKTHLMHNKFIIFDDNSVITGSMNFSQTGLSGFNSNCIFYIDSEEIARVYKKEFLQMLNGKFKNSKAKINKKTYIVNNTKITPLFSPKDKIITSAVIPYIQNAQKYIYMPIFVITHPKLTEILIQAKDRGVDVKIIADATHISAAKSKIKMLREHNIPVKVENYAGKMHSKSLIIDDKFIIAGSMNFTNSGENFNDENALIIEDQRLAKHYRGFFEYIWNKIPDKYLKFNVNPESMSSIGSCSDGIDNNHNGKIDKEEEYCK